MKRLDTQMSESERGTADRVETMEFDFSSKMSDVQEEYAGRTEQLILESGEERGMLRREIAELRESVNILTSELSEKSREALSALSDRGESFLLEFRRNSREARDEVERKVKELRHSVQDSRNKADAHRGEMIAHIDSEYSRLLDNLDEIDKRQKEFVAETRVFERADELKVNLESDIAELGRQLDSVSVGRKEIQGISSEYERAVSLYEEVSGKMSRFLAEQQKVDNLEGKIAA